MSKSNSKYKNIPKESQGAKIRKVRELIGLGIVETADELGIDRNSLSRYEAGESFPRTDFYQKFIKMVKDKKPELYVNYEYFLNDKCTDLSFLDTKTAVNLGLSHKAIDNIKSFRAGKFNLVTGGTIKDGLPLLNYILENDSFFALIRKLDHIKDEDLESEFNQWQLEKYVKEFAVSIIKQLKKF